MTRPWRATMTLLVGVGTVTVGLLLAALAHRGDLVVVVAPFAAALAVGLLRAPRPGGDDERASLELPGGPVWEGDDVQVLLTLPLDPDRDRDIDSVLVAVAHGDGLRAQRPGTVLARVPGEALELRFDAARWGRVPVGPVTTAYVAAHGLLRRVGPSCPSRPLTVLPLRGVFDAVDAVPQAAGLVGVHRSRRPGEGTDLLALRPFAPGDRIRRINWPVSLRTGALHVATTTDDRDTDVQLVVDTSVDIGAADPAAATSLDVTVRSAASIAEFYLRCGDRVGLIDLGTPRRPVRLRGGRRHLMQVLTTLLDAAPSSSVLDHGRGVGRLRDIPPRALVMVFSTLLDEDVAGHVGALAMRGQSVLVIDTLPPDARPPYDHEWTALAWRVALLRREGLQRRLAALGVAVVAWRGAGSLDRVLRELSRAASAPRLRR